MKLDPRIEHPYNILTPYEEDCRGLVGEYCAFANDIETFKNLDECTFGTLKRFSGDENFPFEFEVTVSHRTGTAKFCLPYYKVKKWRPFESLGEFLQKFPLGSEIRYRDDWYVKTQMFTEYWTDSNGKAFVKIGGGMLTFEELFEYTIIEGEDSHPFGVRQ